MRSSLEQKCYNVKEHLKRIESKLNSRLQQMEERIHMAHDDIDVLGDKSDSLEDENTKLKAELKRQTKTIGGTTQKSLQK